MDRRALLKVLVSTSGAAIMSPVTIGLEDKRAQYERLLAAYRAGDPSAVDGLARLARRLYAETLEYRITDSYRDRARLFAEVAHQLVVINYSYGLHNNAMHWVEHVAAYAYRLLDDDLKGLALAMRSLIKKAYGEVPLAIDIAERGRTLKGMSPYGHATVEIYLAGAYAEHGDLYNAVAAFERAEVAITKGYDSGHPVPYWGANLTPDWINYHHGLVLVKVWPKQAEVPLTRAMHAMPAAQRLARAGVDIRLAEAAARSNEPERSVFFALRGLEVVIPAGWNREVERAVRVRDHLATYAPTRLVKQFTEAMYPSREVRGSVQWRNDIR